ncbi:MAG: ferrous iron transport protein B [Anaerolineae bacterium]
MSRGLTMALAGNPNCGKSTIFNALTGARQHVGNWPGKTVEKKEGAFEFQGRKINVVDLPGTYSLTAYSLEEIITRDFILDEKPDVVITVVDAANLERNLYLTVQVLELGVPVVMALNMCDVAESRGIRIDVERLAALLGGAPVVRTVGTRGQGIRELVQRALEAAQRTDLGFKVNYGREIQEELGKLEGMIRERPAIAACFHPRWLAIKLLEGEEDVVARAASMPGGAELISAAGVSVAHLEVVYGDDVDIAIADRRYGFISGLARQVVKHTWPDRLTVSDRIDQVVANRVLGIPIFLLMMYLVFRLVQDVAAPFLDWIDGVVAGPISRWSLSLLATLGAPDWLQSLVVDGAIAGVGGILTFLPGLTVLYFSLALLEDSGYMARAAFVMDRFMRVLGLHGKSFIPMILGFGCAVPAIYATRTLENERDRILTGLLVPLMSCSARLPVYVVFGLAFFGQDAGRLIWAMYALGIVVAVLAGALLSRTLFLPEHDAAFVLELPPYRRPTLKGLLIHTWERSSGFVKRAGTVILVITIMLWFLLNLPWGVESQRDSLFGRASAAAAPVFKPLGFGNWESTGALAGGFIAKEIVVSTMSQIYAVEAEAEAEADVSFAEDLAEMVSGLGRAALEAGKALISVIPGVNLAEGEEEVEDTALSAALRAHFTTLGAVAFVVFVLLYVPCVATLGAIRHEYGTRWAVFSAGFQLSLAWGVALVVFQGGRILGM